MDEIKGKLTGLVMIIMWVPAVNTPTPHPHTHGLTKSSHYAPPHHDVCVSTHPLNKSGLQTNLAGYHDEKAMSESVRRLIKGGRAERKRGMRGRERRERGHLFVVSASECDGSPGGGFHSHAHDGRPSIP